MKKTRLCMQLTMLASMLASLPAFAVPSAPDYVDDNAYLAAARKHILPPDIAWNGKSEQFIAAKNDPYITPIEASDFQHTPTYTETLDYLKKLQDAKPGLIKMMTYGETTDAGTPFTMVIVSKSADKSAAGLKASGKPTVYVEAEIHPGEANGKDAGLMMIRDMTVGSSQTALLDKINLIFVPVVNIDGDLRNGKYGRINQNGPNNTGWRVNSRNLNLNRDFAKLDSPEIRNVARILNEYDPDFFIDTHSTDGVIYQYDVTYCNNGMGWAKNSTTWMNSVMTPRVFAELKDYGHLPNDCISMNDNEDMTQGYYPYYSDYARFSNQYADIRGIPGILVELHALKPYRQQVLGNYTLYKAIFEAVGDNKDSLAAAIAKDRAVRDNQVALTWKAPDGKPQLVDFKGVKYTKELSPITGDKIVRWTNKPQDYKIPYTPQTQPDLIVPRPKAYIVPAQWHEVIDRLKVHGIQMTTLSAPTAYDVTVYRLEDVKLGTPFEPDRESADKIPGYEGRLLITGKPVPEHRKVTYPAGSVVIDPNQRLGVLAMDLLEPASPDSFLSWGFFNANLTSAEAPEAYVMEPMARAMLAESPALRQAFAEKLKKDKAFAKDRNARLNWFYNQTPFADSNRYMYPVGKVE
ncbi:MULTISPECIES: M14 family metallopeptidase [unclassified Paludibacterium]|uniref:M14 family metallopeptidase n=1 Tax=unclassified Paludibacterium TaxID=2618429 RepID=UPI001C050F3D|nr:M14 family metallopeptidase [Paludibacterium sp. B53371]BEV73778.1 M14 family metallopeptidase [Paludibacterium sp. THUN1379]